jgi:hypothetical protein
VVLATEVCGNQGPCCLQPVAGRPAIAHALDVLASSARLRPLAEKLVIVTSPATSAAVSAWADRQGLGSCVVRTTGSGGGGRGGGGDVAAAAMTAPPAVLLSDVCATARRLPAMQAVTHTVFFDAAHALEPATDLSRMVEAAVIFSAAAMAGAAAPLDVPAEEAAALLSHPRGGPELLELSDPRERSSRVTAVVLLDQPQAGSGGWGAGDGGAPPRQAVQLAPICVLSRRALDAAVSSAAAADGGGDPAAGGSMGGLLALLLGAGETVRSWRLEVSVRPFVVYVDCRELYVLGVRVRHADLGTPHVSVVCSFHTRTARAFTLR